MLWLLAACPNQTSPCKDADCTTTPAPHPVTGTPTPTPTGSTGETAADTAWSTTGTLIPATVGTWQACPTLTTIPAPSLEATDVTADHVNLARTGPMEGCVFPTGLLAALDGSTVRLHWQTGGCTSQLCVIGSATLTGLPPGSYTIEDSAPGAALTVDVTVP